ncbi:hypothetical protein F5Y18DRAFT_419937 [Xylariaceae sp. FL1019]|nr:hypothetical protein F5Y18DRAFT_419937 [Xylariaceae sp. FL1019]
MDNKKNAAAAVAAAAAAASAGSPYEHQLLPHPHIPPNAMDRANSPHGSESSYHSAPRAPTSLDALNGLGNGRPYGQHPLPLPNSMPNSGILPMPGSNMGPGLMAGVDSLMAGHAVPMPYHKLPEATITPPAAIKAYPCSTCGKGFARRSDLARHERIHSGVRPHACDWPSCGKQFIQRSALTVHQRVHTKEKPHLCERCGKPFSDSSSLARHRRIHSGQRPYKCPYADCQKTFTRRTTLTRHQNHHTGTIEEAAAATAAALAAQATKAAATRSVRSDAGDATLGSNHASPLNTPSPGQRHMSASPHADMGANAMRANDFSYLSNGNLPVHLRTDVHGQGSASTPPFTTGMRPTSHPTNYQPPPTLEPNVESHQSTGGSITGSPHMGSVGWQSPSHQSPGHMPSPTHSSGGNTYVYPEPDLINANAMGQMYSLSANHIRRSNSSEPAPSTFDIKPRPDAIWQGHQ